MSYVIVIEKKFTASFSKWLSIADNIFFLQVFHFRVDQENRSVHMFPPELITTIFSNIKSIYKFHAEFLLPQVRLLNIWKKIPEKF